MEKCGTLWRSEHETADRREMQGAVYPINGMDGEIAMRACSACAGDYEDPGRTAWTPDDEQDEGRDDTPRATTEEFPAEE